MRAWRVLSCSLLFGCVLPDYQIVTDTSSSVSKSPDAGPMVERAQSDGLATKAPPECAECAATECSDERASCGEDCAKMPWLISPAWVPSEHSSAFAKCLFNKCDATCKVSWGCIDSYRWPQPSEAYTVTIQVGNAFTQEPDVETRITACQASDPGCSTGTGKEGSGVTDADGRVTLTLDPGFFGYFLIEPSDPKYYPMTMVWSQPVYRVDRSFWES